MFRISLVIFFLFFTLISSLFFSCSSLSSDKNRFSEVPQDTIRDGRPLHSSIDFDKDFFDFGTLKQGEVISHIFKFKNTGNIPLIIHDVIPSCGCTKTEPSEDIIKPNNEATLEVIFDSKGWYGSQYKSVTVVTNSLTPKRTITIRANVVR